MRLPLEEAVSTVIVCRSFVEDGAALPVEAGRGDSSCITVIFPEPERYCRRHCQLEPTVLVEQ